MIAFVLVIMFVKSRQSTPLPCRPHGPLEATCAVCWSTCLLIWYLIPSERRWS